VLADLAVPDGEDVYYLEAHRGAGRREAHEWPSVRAAERFSCNNSVALGDLFADADAKVGKGLSQRRKEHADPFARSWQTLQWGVIDEVLVKELVNHVEVTGDLGLVDDPLNEKLVLIERHGNLPLVCHYDLSRESDWSAHSHRQHRLGRSREELIDRLLRYRTVDRGQRVADLARGSRAVGQVERFVGVLAAFAARAFEFRRVPGVLDFWRFGRSSAIVGEAGVRAVATGFSPMALT
jgi:hypothetical protein